jgi:hypothetical protein
MRSRSKNKEVVGSDYILMFGKHKGKALWWVLMNDCGYVVWLVDNDVLSVSEDMYSEAKRIIGDGEDNDYMFGDAGDLY